MERLLRICRTVVTEIVDNRRDPSTILNERKNKKNNYNNNNDDKNDKEKKKNKGKTQENKTKTNNNDKQNKSKEKNNKIISLPGYNSMLPFTPFLYF